MGIDDLFEVQNVLNRIVMIYSVHEIFLTPLSTCYFCS